ACASPSSGSAADGGTCTWTSRRRRTRPTSARRGRSPLCPRSSRVEARPGRRVWERDRRQRAPAPPRRARHPRGSARRARVELDGGEPLFLAGGRGGGGGVGAGGRRRGGGGGAAAGGGLDRARRVRPQPAGGRARAARGLCGVRA